MKVFFRFALLTFGISLVIMISGSASAATGGSCSAFAGGACPANIPTGVKSFYFIDYASGSDSNPGTSESSPWQHLPTCANATGTAAAHAPGAGEGWIFKGGVTVDYHCWPANLPWGGTSSGLDYMGYDPGWYTGSAWARPIFSGGGSSLNADSIGGSLMTDSVHHASYLVVDNIEFTEFYWSSSTNCSVQSGTCGYVSTYMGLSAPGSPDVAWEFKNIYAHKITHGSGVQDQAPYGLFWMPRDAASSFHNSTIDNTDGSDDCCGAVFTDNIYENYFSGLDNVIYNPSASNQQGSIFILHDNWITNMTGTFQTGSGAAHGNCIHVFGAEPSTYHELVYNNLINCNNPNAEPFEIEEDSATVYAFNNVWVNLSQPNGISPSSFTGAGHGGTYYIFQNTVEGGVDPAPGDMCMKLWNDPTVTEENNFCISKNANFPTVTLATGSEAWTGKFTASPSFSITCSGGAQTNWGGSQICAPVGSGDGSGNLNMSEAYPFAPMDSVASAKVGTAPSSAGLCTIIAAFDAAAGTACLSDTTLGVSYNQTNHTVSWPARTPIARPTSGDWEIGAYENAAGSAPQPPTGLSAVVN